MSRTLAAVCGVLSLFVAPSLLAQKNPSSAVIGLAIPGVSDVNGNGTAFFKSVTGIKSETDVIEFREGGANDTTHKLPGATHYGNIVLKRVLTADTSVATWRKLVEDGLIEQARRNGVITIYTPKMQVLSHMSLVDAWPNGLAIETDPDSGDLMEVLTIAVERIRRP